jgi:hypothetical protein
LTNSVADIDGAAPFEDRNHPDSGILQLEEISPSLDLSATQLPQPIDPLAAIPQNEQSRANSSNVNLASPESRAEHRSVGGNTATNLSTGSQQPDIAAELDSLLVSLQQATPHPPSQSTGADPNSLAGILTQISTTDPVTHIQQSIEALNAARQQSIAAQTLLQILHQRNQIQVDRVDAGVLKVKQIEFRTQQLARQSKDRSKTAREMLDAIELIHADIVTNLDKFGGYEEIQAMLIQLETTSHILTIAHDRLTTGQKTFYESLQAIQSQVVTRSNDSESKLRQYQDSIGSLSQTISTDRLQMEMMSVDLSTKLNKLSGLSDQITMMHAQIVEKSQTLQAKIAELDRGFIELSQSVRDEQEQFYELTVGTIEKADTIRSQLADIIKQINNDREAIFILKYEIESVKHNTQAEIERQLNNINLHENELIALCTDLQDRQQDRLAIVSRFSTWLWILSVAVGTILVLLIRILFSLK